MTQTYLLTPDHTTLMCPLPELRSDLLSSFTICSLFCTFLYCRSILHCTIHFDQIRISHSESYWRRRPIIFAFLIPAPELSITDLILF
jgi:hypothetical protein